MTQMRRVILLRHAKSSWADPDQEDHDRPLNRRGRLAAPLIGAWLREMGAVPDLVLCSSAARAIETWERSGLEGALKVAPKLYHADPATMLEALRAAPDDARRVMLVGHEPGIGNFARKLSGPDAPSGCRRAFEKFPTAAAAILDLDLAHWADAGWSGARFTAFGMPRELV